jgi:hypothetical protein
MNAAEIIDELTHSPGLPKAALQAASAHRAAMVPIFLRDLDSYLARQPGEPEKRRPLFFMFHLLGEWREKAAFRPFARLLRRPVEELDAILGDAITATTHRVMAAVFDGDPQPLYEIILDRNAEEFVRSRMCEALAMLVLREGAESASVARFLRDAYMQLLPQAQSFVWCGWQSAIAMLGLSELTSLVRRAFDRGFIDRNCMSFGHFQDDLVRAIEQPGEPRHPDDREYTFFGDTVEELSRWDCFSDEYLATQQEDAEEAENEFADAVFYGTEPYRNPFRGVGRNEPCPCGSGKKFKNCCLAR